MNTKNVIVLHSMVQCMLNRNLCQRIKDYFVFNGYELVDSISKADIVVFSGCGVLESNELEGLNKIAQIEQEVEKYDKKAKIVLVGCLPKINAKTQGIHGDNTNKPHRISSKYKSEIDSRYVTVDNNDYSLLDKIIGATIPFHKVPYPNKIAAQNGWTQLKYLFPNNKKIPKKLLSDLRKNYFDMITTQTEIAQQGFFYPGLNDYLLVYGFNQITIGSGCKNNCAYCAVKFSKDKLVSRPIGEIVGEMEKLVAEGENKFVLLCDDLGSWGADLNKSWTELLLAIDQIDCKNINLALFNLKAEDWLEQKQVVDQLAYSGKISYLCVMSQHVNKRVLTSMRRTPFDSEEYANAINEYGNLGIHIETFTIAGYPGETRQEFEELLHFFEKIRTPHFSNRTNPFSPRYGTQAAALPQMLTEAQIIDRADEANRYYNRLSEKRFASLPPNIRCLLNKMLSLLNEHELLYEEIGKISSGVK